jgi:hypothetical protein
MGEPILPRPKNAIFNAKVSGCLSQRESLKPLRDSKVKVAFYLSGHLDSWSSVAD